MRTLVDRIARSSIALLATMLISSASAVELPGDQVTAAWKAQSVVFDYRSMGRLYHCDVLEHKIKIILELLGAREQLTLKRFACRDLAGRARFEVVMESPVEANDANVRALTDYDSEDELLARLRGAKLPSAAEIETFPAVWTPVSFRRLDLDGGDCALVQQLRRQILPKMAVHITKDIRGVDCSQELTGFAGPRLTVLALIPLEAARTSTH